MNAPAVILATANARYSHPAFGLRWIWANLGPLRGQTLLREYHVGQAPREIADDLLALEPRVLGLGVYIWNVALLTETAQRIKAARPHTTLVLGGPEAAHEPPGTPLFETADYIVAGEGEAAFPALAAAVLEGRPPAEKRIAARPLDFNALAPPYATYTDEDLAHRVLYVEASRGCPFRCAFCMSALDHTVREAALPRFLPEIEALLARGARGFKFVDRTFNLREDRFQAILGFFLERWRAGMQVHLEIMPDRLTPAMLETIAQFPPEGLHLEIGVQSFNPETLALIGRRQDLEKTAAVLEWLRRHTGALIHADLVAGLPAETWASFAAGFDRLFALRPHHIQVGVLKRLKGAPIAEMAAAHGLEFRGDPPYDVTATAHFSAEQLARIKRFARCCDLFVNRGDFPRALPLLLRGAPSVFDRLMALTAFVWRATGRMHALPLAQRAELLYAVLVQQPGLDPEEAEQAVSADFRSRPGRRDRLRFGRFTARG